jgi:hypothetical protein
MGSVVFVSGCLYVTVLRVFLVLTLIPACVIVVEKENLEEALKHEEKMWNGGGRTFFGMWKLPKK